MACQVEKLEVLLHDDLVVSVSGAVFFASLDGEVDVLHRNETDGKLGGLEGLLLLAKHASRDHLTGHVTASVLIRELDCELAGL